jgi:glycosyltransferase involved in cell wall biosynthesis
MRYSIIIPTYNRENLCNRLLKSIEVSLLDSYLKKEVEIIIIDDHTIPIPSFHIDLKIKYIRNTKNRGSAYSRNRAVNIAKGEFMIFLDDDVIVVREFFSYIDSIITSRDVDILGGAILPYIKNAETILFTLNLTTAYKFNFLALTNLIIKKEILTRYTFNEAEYTAPCIDYNFFAKLPPKYNIYFSKKPLVYHEGINSRKNFINKITSYAKAIYLTGKYDHKYFFGIQHNIKVIEKQYSMSSRYKQLGQIFKGRIIILFFIQIYFFRKIFEGSPKKFIRFIKRIFY